MRRRRPGRPAQIAILALLVPAPPTPGQEPTPVFPREVEMVTVDVVVADKDGNPVAGLTRDDFTILDEGEPQTILSFDVVAPETAAEPGPRPPAPPSPPRPRLATNVGPPPLPGRTFVVVFDNLNMSPLNAQRAKAAVLAFLDKGLHEGDHLMLAATSGAWWTTRMPEGRDDLIAVLAGLDGRRIQGAELERMTDYEAMRIYQYSDAQIARRVQDRFERYGITYRLEDARTREADEFAAPGRINLFVDNRAAETYLAARTRNRSTLSTLERVLKPLEETADRKALVLVSEGFIYDPNETGFRRVVQAARRANTALYFVDTRGLADLPGFYGAQFGAPIDERNVLAALADTSQEAEGSAALARDTGGFTVANTNDLETGIVRIGRESRSYYLLGYSPGAIPRDGRFRRLEVRVRRKGMVVRARRGYYAPSDAPADTPASDTDPQLQRALDSPAPLDEIPLRLTAYVLDDVGFGQARTLLAADVDVSRVTFEESDGRSLGSIDTLAVVARRENAEIFRNDKQVDLARKTGPVSNPSWYTIVREFQLPSGSYQARLVVRDPLGGRVGSVALEFEVPPLDQLRVSTPILTDALQQSAGGPAPLAVLLARRTFRPDRPLFCRFDVFGAQKDEETGMPYATAGHRLRRLDGTVVSRAEPTEIVPTSLGALSRLLRIPLDNAPPGDYELVLTVRDEHTGIERRVVEPFTIAEDAAR